MVKNKEFLYDSFYTIGFIQKFENIISRPPLITIYKSLFRSFLLTGIQNMTKQKTLPFI